MVLASEQQSEPNDPNWNTVCDGATVSSTGAAPCGIEEVFINGIHTVRKGKIDSSLRPGQVVTA